VSKKWRRSCQQKKRYVKRFLFCEKVLQAAPDHEDLQARLREPIDIRGEKCCYDATNRTCFVPSNDYEETRKRVSELKRAFSLIQKFTPKDSEEEPSIFHKSAVAAAICDFQETDQKGRDEYEKRVLAERKRESLQSYEPEGVPDHIRHWILTGEGVPAI